VREGREGDEAEAEVEEDEEDEEREEDEEVGSERRASNHDSMLLLDMQISRRRREGMQNNA
jgi:hypothetical protein